MGKGDKPRPTDREKFNVGYDKIWKKPPPGNAKTQAHVDKKKEQKKRGYDDDE